MNPLFFPVIFRSAENIAGDCWHIPGGDFPRNYQS